MKQLPGFKRRDLEEPDNIAAPIISRMATFHPQLSSRLDATVGWRTYLMCELVSFIFSFAIHFFISYLLSKYQKIHRRFPFRLTHFGREIKTFPVTAVTPEDFEYLRLHPNLFVSEKVGQPFNTLPSVPFENDQVTAILESSAQFLVTVCG